MKRRKRIIFSSLLVVVLAVLIFMPKEWISSVSLDEVDVTDSLEVQEIVYKYGIPMNNYDVDFGVVKRNQSLSTILELHGFSIGQIHELAERAKGVFDVRKIKAGQAYALFSTRDSIPAPEFFVYESSGQDYVVFDLREGCKVTMGQHEIEMRPKSVKGKVESSLWNAMPNYGADPLLAIKLSDVFAWTIDFFGIAKGDEFRVLYDEEYVEDQSLQNFHVKGAIFTHMGVEYLAIPFDQDGKVSYYDENGKNLERAFLKAPLDFFRISSRFTNSRYHPVLKRYRAHHGVDYAAPVGTPVYTIGDGTVIAKGFQAGGGGNFVKIKHNSVYTTTYMHLSRFEKGLAVGKRVRQKEVIAYVGSTGLSTGPHLDFRVYKNGTPIDPLTVKSEPKESIRDVNMTRFTELRDTVVSQLRRL